MDQTKIGKLIAKLRKEKGMTQRELGDKVGVGFKAVSKWERGITCPDISIINELSKILGITSDELLTGELSKEHQLNIKSNKLNKKLFFILPILIIIVIIVTLLTKTNKNHVEVYNLDSLSDECYIEGKAIFKNDEMELYINRLTFNDKDFNKTLIKNYSYEIESGNRELIKFGYDIDKGSIAANFNIFEFTKIFTINRENITNINKTEIVKNNLNLKITFLTNDEISIEKNILITLNKSK